MKMLTPHWKGFLLKIQLHPLSKSSLMKEQSSLMLLLFLAEYFAFESGKKDKTFTLKNNSSDKLQDLLDFAHHQICLNSCIIKKRVACL